MRTQYIWKFNCLLNNVSCQNKYSRSCIRENIKKKKKKRQRTNVKSMRSGITLYLSVSSTFIFVISNCRNKEPAKISEVILFIFHLLAGSHKCNCSEITSLSPKVMDTQVAFFFRLTRRNGSAPLCGWWKLPPCRMPKKKKKATGGWLWKRSDGQEALGHSVWWRSSLKRNWWQVVLFSFLILLHLGNRSLRMFSLRKQDCISSVPALKTMSFQQTEWGKPFPAPAISWETCTVKGFLAGHPDSSRVWWRCIAKLARINVLNQHKAKLRNIQQETWDK